MEGKEKGKRREEREKVRGRIRTEKKMFRRIKLTLAHIVLIPHCANA